MADGRGTGRRRLSATVFAALVASALACMLAAFLGTAAVYYATHEAGEAQRLAAMAEEAGATLGPMDADRRLTVLESLSLIHI